MDTGFPGQSIWYGDWKKELSKYDTIILHMEYLQKKIPSYIHRKKPDMRVICWYWNKVNKKPYRPENGGTMKSTGLLIRLIVKSII